MRLKYDDIVGQMFRHHLRQKVDDLWLDYLSLKDREDLLKCNCIAFRVSYLMVKHENCSYRQILTGFDNVYDSGQCVESLGVAFSRQVHI